MMNTTRNSASILEWICRSSGRPVDAEPVLVICASLGLCGGSQLTHSGENSNLPSISLKSGSILGSGMTY